VDNLTILGEAYKFGLTFIFFATFARRFDDPAAIEGSMRND
jgi:hypothetical protein